MKRISCRAVLIIDNKFALMHRIKKDREYYTFFGGGVEENETIESCLKREVKEELGIEVEIERLLYEYESVSTIQYFFLCKYISGVFGSGIGLEMVSPKEKDGKYNPELIEIEDMYLLPVVPSMLFHQLQNDLEKKAFL